MIPAFSLFRFSNIFRMDVSNMKIIFSVTLHSPLSSDACGLGLNIRVYCIWVSKSSKWKNSYANISKILMNCLFQLLIFPEVLTARKVMNCIFYIYNFYREIEIKQNENCDKTFKTCHVLLFFLLSFSNYSSSRSLSFLPFFFNYNVYFSLSVFQLNWYLLNFYCFFSS